MTAPRTKPSKTSIVAFTILLPVLYMLSYAPVYRLVKGPHVAILDGREDWQIAYHPVEWTIINTPLREPLLDWAALWGTRDSLEMELWMLLSGARPEDINFIPDDPFMR